MAKVSAKFKGDFEFWAEQKIKAGHFTTAEMDELKVMIRKDLTEGPDQLRQGVEVITAAGVAMPATIDDHQERYRLWGSFFDSECQEIRVRIDRQQRHREAA